MIEEPIDWIVGAGRKPKGKRPNFLQNPHEERLLSILMAAVAEISVLRERIDTIERLLDKSGTLSQNDIETYVPNKSAAHERSMLTKAYVARVMRGVQQEMEEMVERAPSVESLVDDFSKT